MQEASEIKRDALAWLAGQLRWEATLEELRSQEMDAAPAAA